MRPADPYAEPLAVSNSDTHCHSHGQSFARPHGDAVRHSHPNSGPHVHPRPDFATRAELGAAQPVGDAPADVDDHAIDA